MRTTRVLIAVVAAATLTACGKPVTDIGAPTPTMPAGDGLVIRVEYVDGFVPIQYSASRIPVVSVYADGRVLTEGPTVTIYPGPALPNIEERMISRADVARLAGLAINAGVGGDEDYGQPNIMDAPSTLIVVTTADRSYRTSVNALDVDSGSGLTSRQSKARQKLRDLVSALTDLPRTLGAGAASASEPYRAAAVVALAMPYTPPNDVPTPPAMAWEGPDLPGPAFVTGMELGCLTVTGDQAQAVLKAAGEANTAVGWTSADQKWSVMFRPLLPDESECADLKQR